jgi:hypothetical protein
MCAGIVGDEADGRDARQGMTPKWEWRPPPHERGLSEEERQLLQQTDPNYEYCVIRKKYDLRQKQVWFAAQRGQTVVGRSREVTHRRTFLGSLRNFEQRTEEAYYDLVISLLENGWEPLGGPQQNSPMMFRRRKQTPPEDTEE